MVRPGTRSARRPRLTAAPAGSDSPALRRCPLPGGVGLFDRALRRGVPGGRPRRSCAACSRSPGSAKLVLDLAQRRLGLFDLALQPGDPLDRVLRRAGGRRRARSASRSASACARPARTPRLPGAPRARASTRPSRRRSSAAARPRVRPCGCRPRRAGRGRARRAACSLEARQGVLERLAGVQVEMVRGLVEDQDVRSRRHQDRQRQAPSLAAGHTVHRLLGLVSAEQEAAEKGHGPCSA